MKEQDSYGKDPHQSGAKLDLGKSPVYRGLFSYFPRACMAVAEVSEAGANKYTWKGWVDVPDGINRYSDAIGRHICKEEIEGPIDADYGLRHAAHLAWNALAVLELKILADEKANWEIEEMVAEKANIASEQIKSTKPSFSKDTDLTPGL